MANRIKGITVEIGGDTTGLDKALKGVNTTIRNTQTALKDVSRLLKLDPTNTQLLSQKQKLLSQAIHDTSEKLNILKQADKNAKSQLEQGKLGQGKYDALQREIIETEQSIKRLQNEFKKVPSEVVSSLKQATESIHQFGEKTEEIGNKLSTKLTLPIVGIGTASVASFNEVDEGLDTIVTKTGVSGKQLDEMEKQLQNIATNIPTDFKTAGEAIGEVNTRFGLTGDELEKLSTYFIKFAKINNVNVSNSIDNTQKIMAAFGLKIKDAAFLLDTLNVVGQKTGVNMDTLSTTMISNAATLQQLGFSASDAAFFLGNVEMSGADTSQVMAGLTKALANATSKGVPLKTALADLQKGMVNAKTDTEGLKVAYELFGKKAGAAIYQACKNGSLNFAKLGTSLKQNMGSVEETFTNTIDPIDSFQTTMNQLKIVGAELGKTLMESLKPVLERISEVLKGLKEKWDLLSPGMKDAIINFGLIVATVGPLLIMIGKVVSAIGVISSVLTSLIGLLTGTSAATTAVGVAGAGSAAGTVAAGSAASGAAIGFGALSASLLPIIGIIALIVGAIAGIVLVIQNWGAIVEWFKGVWHKVSETLTNIWQTISTTFLSIWNNLVTFFKGIWDVIKSVIQFAIMFIVELLNTAFSIITLPFRFIWENCKEIIISIWNSIASFIANILQVIANVIQSILATIWNVIKTIWTHISNVISSGLSVIQNVVSTVFNTIKNIVTTIWNSIQSIIVGVVTGIKNVVSSIIQGIANVIGNAFNGVKNTVTNVWNGIKNAIIGPIEFAKNKVKGIIDAISGFFSGIKLNLPKIKLPHFSIKGGFSLIPPKVPKLSIDWYKEGGIMTRPTFFGVNGSSLMAGGEAGAEAILPLKGFYQHLDKLFQTRLNDMANLEQYLSIIASNSEKGIYLEDGTLVGKLLPAIDSGLGKLAVRRNRG